MQPRNPFMGQPPSNMQFPMEAYTRGAANAAAIQAEGQMQMAKGISEGITKAASAIGGAYMQDQGAKSDFSANMAMLKSPSYQKILGLDEDSAKALQLDFSKLQNDSGYAAANKAFSGLTDPLFRYAMMGKELENKMAIARMQTGAQMDVAGMRQDSRRPINFPSSPKASDIFGPPAQLGNDDDVLLEPQGGTPNQGEPYMNVNYPLFIPPRPPSVR